RELNKQGTTIIIASHLLDEVEKVCTHVAILKKGDLLLNGPVDEVLRSEDQVEVKAADMQALQSVMSVMPGIKKVLPVNGILQLSCDETVTTLQINEYCI